MDNNNLSENDYYDDIDLKEFFWVLWTEKLTIFTISVIFALASVFYALSLPNQYKATVVLAPAQSDSGGLSSALGQLGGLASLAGVSIGVGESSESQIAQKIMKSWSFIESFIIKNDLAVEVFAADGWDKTLDVLQIDRSLFDVATGSWLLEDSETDELRSPTSWELFERFEKMLSVSADKKTGLVSVSIEYYSPHISKQWLDLYIDAINDHMQARQVERVSNNINYLEAQIEKTSIAEMREVFYTIIEEQTKNKMVAEASPDYAFVTVSPSMLPEEKSQPNRALICIVVTLFGGLLSVFFVFVRDYLRSSTRK